MSIGKKYWDYKLNKHQIPFINSLNSTLASHERIKKYRILTNHFSIEQDEITATMKIKRNKITKIKSFQCISYLTQYITLLSSYTQS